MWSETRGMEVHPKLKYAQEEGEAVERAHGAGKQSKEDMMKAKQSKLHMGAMFHNRLNCVHRNPETHRPSG